MPSTSYERRKHNRKGWIFRGVGGTKLCQECAISERTKRVLRLQSYEHLFICMLIYENTKRVVISFQDSLSSLYIQYSMFIAFCVECMNASFILKVYKYKGRLCGKRFSEE